MKNLIKLIWMSHLFVFPHLQAQTPDRNQAVVVLNGYVDYCNETIHALWLVQTGLEELNDKLLRYEKSTNGHLSFYGEDYFNNPNNYELIPAEIYKKCISASKILGAKNQQLLNQKLTTLKNTIDKIQQSRNFLDDYVKNKTYKTDEGCKLAWQQLHLLDEQFAEYDKTKNELILAVQKIYEISYKPTASQSKIVNTNKKFIKANQFCKQILEDFKIDKTDSLVTYIKHLEDLATDFEVNQATNLQGLYRFGRNNGLDPDWRYETFVSDLQAFADRCKDFLENTHKKQQTYATRGYKDFFPESFYHYNHQLLNKYNRYGLGLIQTYNKFIELANGKLIQQQAGIEDYYIKNGGIKLNNSVNILLKWAEEPHLFRVADPKPKSETSFDFSTVETGKNIRLDKILFKISDYELLPESYTELDKLATFMQQNTGVEILLEGHTDYIGNAEDNLKLSENRVRAVKNYLISKDIAESRIQIKWYGGTKPLATGETEAIRKMNRRVEFRILKK
ncbi:MAG: OmpA family protein [Verrucomicrobia bacterium]|nr:OmpA family protein [Cytophagales bacterium]